MTRPLLVLALLLTAAGCGKNAAVQMCLDSFEKFETAHKAEDEAAKGLAGDTYQACGISCDVTKDEDACAAFKSVTETMCSKMGKETCEKLCDDGNGEKNDHACAALKSM